MQDLPVPFYGQEEVGNLLLELVNNEHCVWRTSDWISTDSRSNFPSSCRRTARSRLSPVAEQAWLIATYSAVEWIVS